MDHAYNGRIMTGSSWKPKFSVGLLSFSTSGTRGDAVRDYEERFARIKALGGIEGVEFFYPDDVSENNAEVMKELCSDTKVSPVTVFPDFVFESRWVKGSLGSPNDGLRREAIERCKGAISTAKIIGAPYVTIWIPSEGYNHPFQIDYSKTWDWIIGALRELAYYEPSVKLAIEYRPFQPKSRCLIASAGKTFALISEVGAPNVGIQLEVSHALMALEGLGETVAFLSRMKKLFHMHINDSYSSLDTGLVFGAVAFWDCLEMMFWLKDMDYQGYLGLDVMGEEQVRQSMNNVLFMLEVIDSIDTPEFRECLASSDAEAAQRLLWESLTAIRRRC